MNNSGIATNRSDINTTKYKDDLSHPFLTPNQIIGIIIAASVIGLAFIVLMCLIFYQRYRIRISKKHAHSLTSNNPCYVSGPNSEFNDSNNNGNNNGNSSHAHCNMSVLTDFYDIDDLNSLDNDSFLNSLENAIFVGYLNYNRPPYSVDHGLSRMSSECSAVNKAQPVYFNGEQPSHRRSSNNQSRHSSGQNNSRSSIHLRTKKSKRAVSNVDSNTDHVRPRNRSETGCEITRSTSNLISSSKMCLTASSDSVCDSSRGSNQIAEVASQYKLEEQIPKDKNGDNKTESSTDSRTSVNSSSAMMSSYLVENNAPIQALPDLINSSLPKSGKHHKRVSSAYSNMVSREDYIFSSTSRSGQILDPLRAGQTFHFSNETPDSSIQSRHEHHLSHNFGISNIGVFDYNVSS